MAGNPFRGKVENITPLLFCGLLFCIPLSVPVQLSAIQLNIPAEPFIGVLAIILFYLIDLQAILQSKFISHPITAVGLIYHLWMLAMVPFSSDIIVSLKYTLVNLSHFWVFYFGFYFYSGRQALKILNWMACYGFGFLLVVFYGLIIHSRYDFRIDAAPLAIRPFYNDHAIYGASAAFLIAFLLFNFNNHSIKAIYRVLFGVGLSAALILSFSRAAWLSSMVGLCLLLSVKVAKFRFKHLAGFLLFIIMLTGALIKFSSPFSTITAESKKDSWTNHIKSIVNITSDVSNLERINRYSCALRMWMDKPVTGFGPGTFQKSYLSYQKPEEMTRLSVTTPRAQDGKPHPFGRGGGAHSEYFQALAELGFPGLLGWAGLLLASLYTSLKLYHKAGKQEHKALILAILFGLTTYFTHALFNNFLHSEEISALFWAALACLALSDVEGKAEKRLTIDD